MFRNPSTHQGGVATSIGFFRESANPQHSSALETAASLTVDQAVPEGQVCRLNIGQYMSMWLSAQQQDEPLSRQVKWMDKIINEQARYIKLLEGHGQSALTKRNSQVPPPRSQPKLANIDGLIKQLGQKMAKFAAINKAAQ